MLLLLLHVAETDRTARAKPVVGVLRGMDAFAAHHAFGTGFGTDSNHGPPPPPYTRVRGISIDAGDCGQEWGGRDVVVPGMACVCGVGLETSAGKRRV